MKKVTVLVTGGCGFVGKEVVKQLLEKNYSVLVVDDFSNSIPLDESDSLKVKNHDLTNSDGLLEIFKGAQYCIHLAARVGGVGYMNSSKSEILRENILIDVNTISVVSKLNIKLVYASTVIVYDQSKDIPYKEDQKDMPPPQSDYGLSKLIGERLCQSYAKGKGLEFVIARIFNVYGINPNNIPKEKLHVIPDLIRKISKKGKLQLIGGGRQTRTFVHVSDVASALILMMESQSVNGEIFNVASDEKYKILELAKIIWGLLKGKEPFYALNLDFEGTDLIDSLGDNSKISRLLDWKAKISLKDSLPKIVDWYCKDYETKNIS